ncbi:MAG: ABC transporter ATP-binding protein/permease [Taibaiella sp.]|nr:ABC transporter ATP-binding protein/permease [Taibaiella sp.]
MATTEPGNLHTLRRLFFFLQPYKRRFIFSLVLALVLALVAPIRPYLIQLSIDQYMSVDMWQMLIYVTVIQVGVLLIESGLRLVFLYITTFTGQNVVNDMRKAVFKKVIYQRLSYFDKTPIGQLTTRTINDIESINDVFSDGLISILADILTIIAIISIMLYTDWKLTLVSLAVFPVLIIATYYFKESVKKSFQSVRNAVSALNAFVQEHISGMYIVQVFGAEKREQAKFDRINREHRDANIRSIMAYSIFFPVVEIILALSMGLLVWYGASRILDHQISQGVIISFIMYLNLLFRPLRMLADKFNTLQMGMVAGERVMNVLDSDETLHHNGTYIPKSIKGDIRFEQVHFSYVEHVPVLKGISFEAKAGETLALVGHTGAGKSSIISILTRLYEIQGGRILIDGKDIMEYDIYELRKRVAIVLQDVFLFSGTIRDNITLQNEKIPQEKVTLVCKELGIHEMIMRLPGGYGFNVMERGNSLSQGQRQLISFARALILDPSILILDEATASVDSESEILIQKAIDKMISGRTAIVIAHRLSTVRKAEKIIVLDKGSIAEQGTHDQLIEQEGIYYAMYQAAQKKEEKI